MIHNSTDADAASEEDGPPVQILFIFSSCALGALVRLVTKRIALPYTVVMFAFGAAFGAVGQMVPHLRKEIEHSEVNPHTILYVFLPVLIFESAYAMEAHMFFKSFPQITILALPGLGIATLLTAGFSSYVFGYGWGWGVSLMFGSIVSATDPVAVVAVLKDVGAAKQLSILLEGESLLNDGVAIVLYHVFNWMAKGEMTTVKIIRYSIQVSFGGVGFGFFMAKTTIFWLRNIFNDALAEITITLASTYLTFYIAEAYLNVSGVVSVVVLGVTLNNERTCVSPEVETFLHRFWEMLAYLANTLIFILVGMMITTQAISRVSDSDWVLTIALYCAVTIIRAVMIMVLSPLLKRIGYGLSWQNGVVMVWGGLRGAVGLALALIVLHDKDLDEEGKLQSKVLMHTAALVLLTLLVNATTITTLLGVLGMSTISIPKRLAMATAVRNLEDVVERSLSLYKSDRFLADADWDEVEKYIGIEDPYETTADEAEMDALTHTERVSICPNCNTEVPNEPSPRELNDMRHEARLRLLKAQKISYWKQFEHGMVSREAVRKLVELVDTAADISDAYIDTEEIKKTWQIKGFLNRIKMKLETLQSNRITSKRIPQPRNRLMLLCYSASMHPAFDIVMYIVIVVNIVAIVTEFEEEAKSLTPAEERTRELLFFVFNVVFIVIYILEAIIKIMGLRLHYFKSHWNQFDFLILAFSMVDMGIDISKILSARHTEKGAPSVFSPSILRIAKAIRILRVLRSLRLVKAMIPQVMGIVNNQVNKQLRFGYDVGKGYVVGEEEVQNFITHMIDSKKIASELRQKTMDGRSEILKGLGLLQKTNPGVAVSIKTQQAARRILNNIREKIIKMRSDGVLDEGESEKLEVMIETRMKKLLKIPTAIPPPPPERIIGNLAWVMGDETLIEYIKHNALLVSKSDGETIEAESDPKGGIYVIVSGLVKVEKSITLDQQPDKRKSKKASVVSSTEYDDEIMTVPKIERVTDYLSTGSVLGEMSLLTCKPSSVKVTCETSAQLYHIPYDAIQAALELFTDEPSLEYRLWRVCGVRIAAVVLHAQPMFDLLNLEKLNIYLDKALLYLRKSEIPEGGRFSENIIMFDINPTYMNDIILVHGEAENAANGETFIGPCYISNKIERLLLIPGRTDKHVIIIVPREPGMGGPMANAGDTSGMNIALPRTERLQSVWSSKGLCLRHSSVQRASLEKKMSEQVLDKKKTYRTWPRGLVMSLDRIRSRTSAVSPGTIVSEPSRSLYSAIVRSPIYTRVTDAMSRSGSFRSRTLSTSTNTSHRTPSHAPSDDYEANSPSPVTWNARGTALCSAPAVSVSNIGFPQKRHRIRFLLDSSVESESPSITSQTSLKKAGFKTIRMPIIRNTGYFSRDVNHRRKSYATYLRDPILDRFSKMISRRESRDRDLSMSPEDDDDNNQRTNSRGIPPVE